jgi:NHLM bacteriocin system ABC transporter peptidase/ATP-binding protein
MSPIEAATARRTRVRTPEQQQMAPSESGAASLGILLAAAGRWVPLEELRDACGVTRDGTTPEAVAAAAGTYGLDAEIRQVDAATLVRGPFPVIATWRSGHFLVVEGVSSRGWYLNDPAIGHRVASSDEFEQAYGGTAIRATPGPGFQRGGSAPGALRRLAAQLHGSYDAIALVGLIGLVLVVPTVLIPGLGRVFVDALAGQAVIGVPAVIGALILAAVLQAVLIGLQASIGLRLAMKVTVLLGARVMDRLLRLPMQFAFLRGPSALNQRAQQPEVIATTVASLFSTVAVAVLSSTTAAIILVIAYPPGGLVAIVSLVILIGFRRFARKKRRSLAQRIVRDTTEVAVVTATTLGQIEVIKATGAEDTMVARWARAHDRLQAATQELGEKTSIIMYLPKVISSLAATAVTLTALAGVNNGSLSLGGLVAVQTLNGLVLGSIPAAVTQLEAAQNLGGQLDQIDDVLNTPPDPRLVGTATQRPPVGEETVSGDLELIDVTFGYDRNAPPLVNGLNLHLTPGKRIALVGPSGCGKSTVSRLVVGWYDPWSGVMLVDGRPRDDWPEEVLTSYIAIVEQDPTIFSGTFRDNITMWNPTIPEADVIRAAQDACLHEDIVKRPGGYDAVLAEQGDDLSGGQRQRLEIARALARNPSLIVLDEATSALDAATEAAVDAAIRRRGSAVLVIAHRLSTIRDCDEIIMLDRGNVVERGTHDELVGGDGPYARLVRS